jgi:glycosyltransferase involved in cell wall biosynthesis
MARIIYVISGLSTGGAETMLLKLLERIDRSRFDPMVISLTTRGEVGPRIEALGIPVISLKMRPSFPNPLLILRLVKIIKQFEPEIVHTWMYHADLLGGLAARLGGVKRVVWAIRNSNLSCGMTKPGTLIVVKTSAWLSSILPIRIISCSARARDIHISIGYVPHKMSVIPNGFDLLRFSPDPLARLSVRQELGLNEHTTLIGMIGRYDPQKNHLGFVEAARLIHQQRPELHFLLAGAGVEKINDKLWVAIQKAGLNQHFHLLGRRDDMPRLMAALDLLVSSSYGEAFPNVLGEAMACEVPCVVTDVGDSAYIVGDAGSVVSPGNMAALACALENMLKLTVDERRDIGKRARARVAEHFEIGKVVQQYEVFYNELFAVRRLRK